jgi:transposase
MAEAGRDEAYLLDMLLAARDARAFVGGLDEAAFRRSVKHEAAVGAAITSPWSNRQTEGQLTRLKLVNRQIYERAKVDLLHAS